MSFEILIRRYAAYYRGWCQAFGEHEIDEPLGEEPERAIQWLYGEQKIGLILPHETRKAFFRQVVGRGKKDPVITFSLSSSQILVNKACWSVPSSTSGLGIQRLVMFLGQKAEVHLFLTHHLCYAPGTRIITFSRQRPLVIMYKEIDPLRVRVT